MATRATVTDPGGSGATGDVTDSQQNVGAEAVVAGGDAEGQVALLAGGIEVKPPDRLQRGMNQGKAQRALSVPQGSAGTRPRWVTRG